MAKYYNINYNFWYFLTTAENTKSILYTTNRDLFLENPNLITSELSQYKKINLRNAKLWNSHHSSSEPTKFIMSIP